MRYYRRKANQKRKTVIFRILFVLAAACLVTGLAILTGNFLLAKVDSAEEHMETSVPPSGNSAGRVEGPVLDGEAYSSLYVYASGLSLPLHETDDSLVSRIHTISDNYDTVSVEITDEDGLMYLSPALCRLLRMPEQENDPIYLRMENLCTAARAQGLRISAVLSSSIRTLDSDTAALFDSTIAAELYAMGFDEILFVDLFPETIDTDSLNIAKGYLQHIREMLAHIPAFSIGASLPYSVYLDAVNAKQVQMIATAVDFLAIDCSNLPVQSQNGMTLEGVCQSLAGSFEVYNLRVLLHTEDLSLLSAQSNVLSKLEITNVQYIGEITPSLLTESAAVEEEETAPAPIEENPVSHVNPYATTQPSSGVGSMTDGNTSSEPEETYYRSEEGSWF